MFVVFFLLLSSLFFNDIFIVDVNKKIIIIIIAAAIADINVYTDVNFPKLPTTHYNYHFNLRLSYKQNALVVHHVHLSKHTLFLLPSLTTPKTSHNIRTNLTLRPLRLSPSSPNPTTPHQPPTTWHSSIPPSPTPPPPQTPPPFPPLSPPPSPHPSPGRGLISPTRAISTTSHSKI